MTEQKRYLVGFKERAAMPRDLENFVDTFAAAAEAVRSVKKLKNGQHILEMTKTEAARLAKERPDLVIEEDLELELFSPMPGLLPRVPAGSALTLKVKATNESGKTPVPDTTIYCVGREVAYRGETDSHGVAIIAVMEPTLQHIIASPRAGYWSQVVPSVTVVDGNEIHIRLKELPAKGNYTWGHAALGMERVKGRFTGKGVKIALIDSGIAGHEDLLTAGGYNTLDGRDPGTWNVDEKGHGTHCSGIVAAQVNPVGVKGVAPDAEIYSLKVFPGGRLSDLLEAINWCIDNYIDVISMSLGSPSPSEQIAMALVEAYEHGITCVAAAGNDGGTVAYPAAYESVIAVSAVGRKGTFPVDSAHALKVGDYVGRDGKTFFARFSNRGPEIAVCAPGVAIPSTVPTGYAAWDGTSMACPFVTGLAALILEAYPEIRTGNVWQPYYVREIIANSAVDLGLPTEMQGAGIANVARALGSALLHRHRIEGNRTARRRHLEALLSQARRYADELELGLGELGGG